MPYSLKGNSVVKSDSGEVVKTHPTRERALAHLRALKANVREGSPAVLGALIEGFDPGEMRDEMGRWVKGATSPRHGAFKIGDHVTHETGSRGAGGHGPVTFTRQPGVQEVVGFQRNGNLRLREPRFGTTVDVHHTHAQKVPAAPAFDSVTMLGREGTAARARGAGSKTVIHADIRDKLTNLPEGQRYTLAGPQGQVGHVQRTSGGFEVYTHNATPEKVHSTPSAAAGHAMRLERSAFEGTPQNADVMARNYRHGQEVRAMNARQSQRAEAEAERQLEIRARMSSSSRDRALAQVELERRRGARTARPRIRESVPAVLGALLDGA